MMLKMVFKTMPRIIFVSIFLMPLSPHKVLAQQVVDEDKICIFIQGAIDDGSILFSKGEYNKAIAKLYEATNRGAHDSCPNLMVEAYRLLAEIHAIQLNFNTSITSYLAAITFAEKLKSDYLLSELYIGIADIFFRIGAHEKAVEYYTKTLPLLSNQEQEAQSLYVIENLALSLLGFQQQDRALEYLNRILSLTHIESDQHIRTRTLFRISEIYRQSNEWDQAIEYCQKLYYEQEFHKDNLGAVLALNNKAYNEIQKQDYPTAISSLKEALKKAQTYTLPNSVLAGIYTNLGVCYQNQGRFSLSLDNLFQAADITKDDSNSAQLADIYNTTAWVYHYKGDLYNASRFASLSISEAKKANDPVALSNSYYTYSQFLRDGNDHISALEYYEKYSKLRDSLELEKRIQKEKDEQLTGQIERTEREQRLYLADKEMKDLMVKQLMLESESRKQEIELLKKERELEQSEKNRVYQNLMLSKKEQEAALQQSTIRNLEQENSIKALQIQQKETEELRREQEIALLQSEKERQQLQIEKEAETRMLVIWMLVLSLLVLTIVVVGLITTRKKNQLLADQKKQIEEKNLNLESANTEILQKNVQLSELAEEIQSQNEEIIVQRDMIEARNLDMTSSIQYARLIQNAVLPSIEALETNFKNHFVLYKPRDIVSGDFWWFHAYKNRKIIAVADCTGHGVPGAFLSMLGTTLLSEIVSHQPEIRANILLDNLRAKMRETMMHGKTTSLQLDGMDIAVCIVNDQTKEIEIAGAYNPVYIIRDGDIEIIKADKIPIGLGGDPRSTFNLNIWKAKPKDRFYLFSDGYADQFGGEHGRKLMVKNFRKLLVQSAALPMDRQKEFLDQQFLEWQGNSTQIDDVLVLGFEM